MIFASRLRAVERRSHQRVRLRVIVEVGSVTSFHGFSADVSTTGICVVAEEELPVDSLIDVEFNFPDGGEPFDAFGEIRRKRRLESDVLAFVYGVEFLNVSESDQRRLDDLVRRHAPRIDVDLDPDEVK